MYWLFVASTSVNKLNNEYTLCFIFTQVVLWNSALMLIFLLYFFGCIEYMNRFISFFSSLYYFKDKVDTRQYVTNDQRVKKKR